MKALSIFEQKLDAIGWAASLMGVIMFLTFVDQIRLNIAGQSGSLVLPLATALNCAMWILYASLKAKPDWPIVVCNALGVLMGLVTFATALGWHLLF